MGNLFQEMKAERIVQPMATLILQHHFSWQLKYGEEVEHMERLIIDHPLFNYVAPYGNIASIIRHICLWLVTGPILGTKHLH
jgi:hypothetical protein